MSRHEQSATVPADSDKLLLSIPEACALLGLSRTTLYELISAGEIKTKKIRRRRMVIRAALESFCRK